MCGRYTLVNLAQFTDMFPWVQLPEKPVPPRYNIAPTQPGAVIINRAEPIIDFYHWGLVPSWASDPSVGSRMINARSETLAEKPAFRKALSRRRCLVPASGFYEWKLSSDGKTKTPYYIQTADEKPFAFAGLWESWHSPDGSELRSYTIITTIANEMLSKMHQRMPVILDPESYRPWLSPRELPAEETLPLLKQYPAELMMMHPVSARVSSVRNDSPQCTEKVEVVAHGLWDL